MVTATEMVTAAKAKIENLTPAQVAEEIEGGEILLVDVREPTETAQEIIGGALQAPRGMLEFYADPSTPYHLDGGITSWKESGRDTELPASQPNP